MSGSPACIEGQLAGIRVAGEVESQNSAPVRINNMFAAGNGSAQQGSLSVACVAC
ncbi:MAG TPA: hypothetical protein VN829_17640 [Dongiaceae bacterium]|nr:hypothetical protein SBA4_4100014 [Candidatus Sulfopaludibacter sp. SbA4]HXP62324.1 hypothetical protein [Dongiaceae bacterium]